jgi:LPS-assembly protein
MAEGCAWVRDGRMSRNGRCRTRFATATAVAIALACASQAMAQAPAAGGTSDRMVVDADQLVYDKDKDTVSAVGSVQILHKGRIIEADRVVYDRKSKRVVAQGNARITETNGTVITGSRFNLTDDFRDGFIDSLRVENPDRTRFTAPRAERTSGEAFVFERGTYTACEPCKDNPERPPLWQVKATRIIHNNEEKMIYYENAQLEFWGVPLAYFPYFSTPDPSVKRKTGFLPPRFINTTTLGQGLSLPFFWNLAPNYDLTITPTYLSRQGVLGEVEWRHRLMTGAYNIRASGISQADDGAFLVAPLGPGPRAFRGSFETAGKFFINERWNFGWDIAASTDKWFFQHYRVKSESITATFFRESTSSVHLTGQSPSAWFDLRGYHIRPLSGYDWQKQQPLVHPVLDYNKRTTGPGWLGGELSFDVNVTSLTREAAHYNNLPRQLQTLMTFNAATTGGVPVTYTLYDTCAVFQRGQCIVRGMGGTMSRATAEVAWKRNIIDDLGQVWTPYASLRADGIFAQVDTASYQNAAQTNFGIQSGDNSYGRVMPAIGLMYRFPFIAQFGSTQHIIEPIAQIVARPNERRSLTAFNEDAQSLVFDDTTLFAWNKFSGYDRVEGGVRANVGVQYTARFSDEAYLNAVFGQSYHLAGRNSYTSGDIANTGRDSGLQRDKADYVAAATFVPEKSWRFSARARFDSQSFDSRRLEISAAKTIGDITASVTYARLERQPELGFDRRREGLYHSVSAKFLPNWSARAGVLYDLDKYLFDREVYNASLTQYLANPAAFGVAPVRPKTTPLQPTTVQLGLTYMDECTTFDVSYTQTLANRAALGAKKDQHTLMFRLELRTLGAVNYRQNFGTPTTADGVGSTR